MVGIAKSLTRHKFVLKVNRHDLGHFGSVWQFFQRMDQRQ